MSKTVLQLKDQNTASKLVFDVTKGFTSGENHLLVVRNGLEGGTGHGIQCVLIGDRLPAVLTMQATFLYRPIYSKFNGGIV